MNKFEQEYQRLNKEQKQAVDTIDGPVLVIAGPGTGKTQLLSMRAANILRKTDILPSNILCMTFTDNAARNMRERLAGIIGQPAYHVSIQTFHSFGSDVINQSPDYFANRQLLQQVDELGKYELLRDIFEQLPHSNPLSTKVGDQFVHLKSTLDVISWLKQNALAPHELHKLINANQKFIEAVSGQISDIFASTPSPKQLATYGNFLEEIKHHITGKRYFGFPEYTAECALELEEAIVATDAAGRYAPKITAWRNQWCKKDAKNQYVFKDGGQAYRKMHAVANAYEKLLDSMAEQGLYDFDDMVGEAVHAMENNDELRYNLQERYQYVLVDEFQDTNKAQLRMLACLGDNPIHENRPNIMAVGDDDQAIYAFQGAEVSNMIAFSKMYDDPALITLKDNYRSNADILEAGFAVAEQITDRMESIIPQTHKQLTAKATHKNNVLDHRSFSSELAQYDWIAEEISRLIKSGVEPEEIAVIAPRHKYLERLMPYLGSKHIPVAYERRENILEAPVIKQLITMAELVVAIADNRQDDVDALISQVLSYDFWLIPPEDLMEISLDCYNKHKHWLPVLTKHKNKQLSATASWFIELSKKSKIEPMEYMLDQLIGTTSDEEDSQKTKLKFVSPMRGHYFNQEQYEQATEAYLTLLGQLSTLRHRLRQWKPNRTIYVHDLAEFSELHFSANLKIIDTNPHTQTTNAVQVMTAYKAKGLEFEAVFVVNAQDEIWGPTARSQSSRIALPKNLPIEPAGGEDNDKLRLLFVALTRAKHTLHVTSYTHTLENKLSPALSFIIGSDEQEAVHPSLNPQNIDKPATSQSAEILATDWAYRFRQIIADKQTLFEPILANYKLSVTHLNNFTDVRDGGPKYFFTHNLLRFPEALSPSAAYGDAIHKTFQWIHTELRGSGKLPTIKSINDYFSDMLVRTHLRKTDYKRLNQRGHKALELYIQKRGSQLSAKDLVERGFNNEGVIVKDAALSGKIDKLCFRESNEATVVDFKTGKPAVSWQGKDEYEKVKLHKYRQQLLFYKLLVENSASFRNKLTVTGGAVEFIEVDDNGELADSLELSIKPDELEEFIKLVGAIWTHITNLDFPDTEKYPKNLRGIKDFEKDLISGNI
jgi:DNA helicase-2/ATP-dependent DNA helicase PcrA